MYKVIMSAEIGGSFVYEVTKNTDGYTKWFAQWRDSGYESFEEAEKAIYTTIAGIAEKYVESYMHLDVMHSQVVDQIGYILATRGIHSIPRAEDYDKIIKSV